MFNTSMHDQNRRNSKNFQNLERVHVIIKLSIYKKAKKNMSNAHKIPKSKLDQ